MNLFEFSLSFVKQIIKKNNVFQTLFMYTIFYYTLNINIWLRQFIQPNDNSTSRIYNEYLRKFWIWTNFKLQSMRTLHTFQNSHIWNISKFVDENMYKYFNAIIYAI